MNVENVQKTLALLREVKPEQVLMRAFLNPATDPTIFVGESAPSLNFCNTAGCVAGWAMLACRPDVVIPLLKGGELRQARWECERRADGVLGLGHNAADELFSMSDISLSELGDLLIAHGVINDPNKPRTATEMFDLMAPAIRKQALINVLERMLETYMPSVLKDGCMYASHGPEIDWMRAIKLALGGEAARAP